MTRPLLVISASPDQELASRVAADRSPRKDYIELARETCGVILYRDDVNLRPLTRAAARLFGKPIAQALLAFLWRDRYDAVFTDAENIGIPFALLCKLFGVHKRHVMLGHLLTTRWKLHAFRLFRLRTHVTVIICHASRQRWLGLQLLGVAPEQLLLLPYHVDERFWRPMGGSARRQLCSAGLEFRDYRTLIAAVRELDVDVVIAAASHWSRRRNETEGIDLPPHVRVTALNYEELRCLYAESLLTVVPLHDVDFQAGITVLLETMAMAKPIVITRTRGQIDVVQDEHGLPTPPPGWPDSGFGHLPMGETSRLGPTGLYVPPHDPVALRHAIESLLADPARADALGRHGRSVIERLMTLDQFVERIAALLKPEATLPKGGPEGEPPAD